MAARTMHDGRDDGLSPLQSLDLGRYGSFSELVRAMGRTAFGGRRLGEALDVLVHMARDESCFVVLTISGAMTVAKQGLILCELIDRGLVNAVVSTGALIAHGLTESIGCVHYAADPNTDDATLFAKGYNRIYDTLEMEANLTDVASLVSEVLDHDRPPGGVWSSASFCRAVGRRLVEEQEGAGILASAARRHVPVFIPAFTDSEIGLDLAVHAVAAGRKRRQRLEYADDEDGRLFEDVPSFNPFLDLQEYARLAGAAETLGILTIGGGVPRNWAQQVAPYYEITADRLGIDLEPPRFTYGVRICPEPDHWGGLSGCTYAEGVSWGKFVPTDQGGRYAEVHADATIAMPLLMSALFETLDAEE